jgi:hypothetical protein
MEIPQALVRKLAGHFLLNLKEGIGEKDYRKCCVENARELNPNVCHSHDYCDANEIMAATWLNLQGEDFNGQYNSDVTLWNAAWDHAKGIMKDTAIANKWLEVAAS